MRIIAKSSFFNQRFLQIYLFTHFIPLLQPPFTHFS